MCVEERWYSLVDPRGQLLDLLSYPNLWFEYGLSSNQIRTNDIRNVVLLVVDSSSIHHYIFGLTNTITCSHNYGIPFIWKLGWIVVEPISNIVIFSMILLNIKLVLETCVSIFFMPRSWSICLDERSDFLSFMCIRCKLPQVNLRKLVLLPLESSQVSHAYVRSILWPGDLQPSFYMCP